MPADSILVVDAGTSAMRALLVDACGGLTPLHSEPWRMLTPADAGVHGRELDARDVEAALRRAVASAYQMREHIAGVAVTGQREGVVFLDGYGAALLVSPNVDARASAEGMALDAAHGEQIYAATGHLPSLLLAPAKLAWLRRSRPDVRARVRGVLPLADWVAMLLDGAGSMTRSLGVEIGLIDLRTGAAASDLLAALECDPALVRPVVADGCVVGEGRADAVEGLPVVAAGADTQCGTLGCGALEAGDVAAIAGWSAPVQMVCAAPFVDPTRMAWSGAHVVEGRWVVESNAGDTGRAWSWFCALCGLDDAAADAAAAAAPVGSHDVMTVLGPPAMRASAMVPGLGGLTLPVPFSMSSPATGDVLRSVLEAIAYALRGNLEQLERLSGARVEQLLLGGGMSRSALFTQIVADVVDRPVRVARAPETTALGAAALASRALGLHASLDDAVGAMVAGGQVVRPRLAASAEYEDHYARWCALGDTLERAAGEGG